MSSAGKIEDGPWLLGRPPYDDHSDRTIYLTLHSRGSGHFVVSGRLHGEHPPTFPEEQAAWLAWMRSGQEGERPHQSPLVPHLCVPELRADMPLSEWVNIVAWMETIRPEPFYDR